MADFTVSVTENGLVPAVIYAGGEGANGKTITFNFSSDWDGYTKEILFYDMRGNVIVTACVGGQEINIPDELTMYGGHHKFTVRGFTLDDDNYIDDSLQVTGTIVTTYTAGHNPRLEGKLLPSTLDLFLAQAETAMNTIITEMVASGAFDGADGANGTDGADGTSAGFGTPTATAVALSPNSQPTVSVTASGSDTAKVFAFEFGIPGAVVEDLRVLGHYASLAALQAAVTNPTAGDAYSVGSSTPYNIYIYDGVSGTWANYGTIGGGASVTIDTAMSSASTNAVQNLTIKAYVDGLIGDVNTAITAINAIVGA